VNPLKRALQFGQSLLRTFASHLASWADRLQNTLGESSDRGGPFPRVPVAKENAPGPAIDEERTVENKNVVAGPPQHWVERVRQPAPELLRPRRNVPPDAADKAVPEPRPFPAQARVPSRPASGPVRRAAPRAAGSKEESQKLHELAAVRAPIRCAPAKSA